MAWNLHTTIADEGDLAQLVGLRHNYFLVELHHGDELHTHRGIIKHNDIIGKPWGSQLFTHSGNPYFLLQPALGDLLRDTPRNTQILYPKEIGHILVSMGIGPGQFVIEAGTGSGALTRALAFAVGDTGRVVSYEVRGDIQPLAVKNLARLGYSNRVQFKIRDIANGFDETNCDALFLDLPNPYDYIRQTRAALKPGGFFGSILPTTNQVSKLIASLRQMDFAFIEVCEILLRYYRPEPDRLRPSDRMVAHTGFLIFARPVIISHGTGDVDPLPGFEETNSPRIQNGIIPESEEDCLVSKTSPPPE